jgi:pyruvate formate lyase activating enzyme
LKGLVFDLQRYSIHDGPGIRTVVFLKGCPLHCLWCCNPESQRMEPELEFRASLCQQCGKCISICPEDAIHPDVHISAAEKIDHKKCTNCGECVKVCPNEALRLSGMWLDSEEVFRQCIKDANDFRRSGGGVTLSGGEPLVQPEFALEVLQKLYNRNVHTAVETTGFTRWESIEPLLPFTNLFLFDIKHIQSEKHFAFTGVANERILVNLEKLARSPVEIIIRIPIIPGINDDLENLNSIAILAVRLSIPEVHLMPFHQFGKEKYSRFGYLYSLAGMKAVQDTEEGRKSLLEAQTIFSKVGITAKIGG